MYRLIKGCVVMPLACLALLTLSQRAEGAFTLTLRQGSNTMTFTDGGPGDLTGANDGLILLQNQRVGDYMISLTTGSSNQPGEPTEGRLTLAINRVARTASNVASPLEIIMQDTDFTMPGADGVLARLMNTIASSDAIFPAGASLQNVSEAGREFGTASEVVQAITDPAIITTSPDSDETDTLFTRGPDYDLRSNVTVNLSAGQQINGFDANTSLLAVPEPGSMLVMLSGVGVLGLVRLARGRRKQR